MINNVVLTGRLTKDAEIKYFENGSAKAQFTLAVQRKFKSENQPEADFINCVVWNKAAEILADYTKKGSLIGVEGRIETRNYENGEGNRVYVTEVVVENFTFLESKKQEEEQPQPKQAAKGGFKKNYSKR
jgi:single-strand DNA-binding protein